MAILKITIRPKTQTSSHANTNVLEGFPGTYGMVRYYCLENPLMEETGEPFDGVHEEEFELSDQFVGETQIWDWDDTTSEIAVSIHSSLGIVALAPRVIQTKNPVNVGQERCSENVLELTDNEIKDVIKRMTAPEPEEDISPALIRSGQFFSAGISKGTLPKSMLVTCIKSDEHKKLLDESSQKVFDSDKAASIAEVAEFPFMAVKLGTNGIFEFTIPRPENCSGWLWVLSGIKMTVGYVKEENPGEPRAPVAILLADESISAEDSSQYGTSGSGVCSLSSISGMIPKDAPEQDLLANADIYGEDPGTYCEPFRNPNRILSEKAFFTILRVQAPAIGGLSSFYPSPTKPVAPVTVPSVNIASAPKLTVLNRIFGSRSTATEISPIVAAQPEAAKTTGLWQAILNSKRGKPETASKLKIIPGLRIPPILGTTRRRIVSASSPIDWESNVSRYQATTVGLGHILEFRLRWRSNGYSLGDVIHTLTLAPRQTKRITSIQWNRSEEAKRTEYTKAGDTVKQETTSERRYSDVVQSSLDEWSKGESKSSTTGAAGGIGFAMGPVVIGGGVAHGQSQTSSQQNGGRDITAREEQSLRDAVRQYADSLRKFESSVVTEISQEEVVTGISEILRNPNYCHALTVVYHQILRHLRVDTELAGVRECVFVPLAIKPFDDPDRVIRWRDIISRYLLDEDLRWVMKYLDELKTNFSNNRPPKGPRSSHPIRYISGSVFVKLSIQRPPDNAADSYDETAWSVFSHLIHQPLFGIFARLREQVAQKRDQIFQSEIAPAVAREWANALQMFIKKKSTNFTSSFPFLNYGNEYVRIENVDFTLASSYLYNGTIRIDFSWVVPSGMTVTRSDFESIKLYASWPLVKGSIANLINVRLHYETDTFQHDVRSSQCTDDLINPTTGAADSQGATARISLDSWETEDLQEKIRQGADRLYAHLNEHIEYYHKCIWWNMDRDRLFMLLDGFLVPGDEARSLASVVERDPIAVVGNSLVFRVSSGAFLNVGNLGSPKSLLRWYMSSQSPREPLRISLPTSGLYAKALKDKCNACEEHMGSVDWVLTDKEPELETIGAEGLQSRRAEPTAITPTPFQTPIINLQNAPAAPQPTGLGSILEAVTKSDAFRDMAGLAGTQANAATAMQTAASLASEFGSKALELQKSKQATEGAPQKLSNIRRAQEVGLLDEDKAKDLTQDVLKEMNIRPSEQRLTAEPVIQNVLNRATDVPANPIEIVRGGETIRVGDTSKAALLSSEINNPKSGSHWRQIADSKGWISSCSLEDLEESFQANVKAFKTALENAGASVSVGCTYRAKERAWLMHFAWDIANGEKPPSEDPYKTGIIWDHGSDETTKQAAKEMKEAFNMSDQAALSTRHMLKRAVDMTISWTGDLKIKKKDGSEIIVKSTPRTGNNTELHDVGKSYGVIKLVKTPPDVVHWSDNGS